MTLCKEDIFDVCQSAATIYFDFCLSLQNTFKYDPKLWTNHEEYLAANGATGFDEKETKLSTFSNTSFKIICVGMKQNWKLRFLPLNVRAKSMYSQIADGKFRPTHAAKESWLGLLRGSALQNNCNEQGFNVGGVVRIGMRANQENDCKSCDSWIGFGRSDKIKWLGSGTCGILPLVSLTKVKPQITRLWDTS